LKVEVNCVTLAAPQARHAAEVSKLGGHRSPLAKIAALNTYRTRKTEPRAQGWVKRGVPERPRDTCDPQGSGGGGAAIRLTRKNRSGPDLVLPYT